MMNSPPNVTEAASTHVSQDVTRSGLVHSPVPMAVLAQIWYESNVNICI